MKTVNNAEQDVARLAGEIDALRAEHAAAVEERSALRTKYSAVQADLAELKQGAAPNADVVVRKLTSESNGHLHSIGVVSGKVSNLDGEIERLVVEHHWAQQRALAAPPAASLGAVRAELSAAESEHERMVADAAQVSVEQAAAVEAGDAGRVLASQVRLTKLQAEVGSAMTRLLQLRLREAEAQAAALVEQAHEASGEAERLDAAVKAAIAVHDQAMNRCRDISAQQVDWQGRRAALERQLAVHVAEQRRAAAGLARSAQHVGALLAGAAS